jgi:CPA1 family monovalent cation:H+ antiporter
MGGLLGTEKIIIGLLLVISLVAMAVRQLRIPYSVALVIIGLLIASQSSINFELTPELILALFVPPLVFEAAFHISFNALRRDLSGILLLAVPGVIITTLVVGGIVKLGTSLSLPVALVFGALIAATDPVSVVALFRSLGVPKRLSVLVESESLFNDGTAIVTFNLLIAFALTGQFNLAGSVVSFIVVAAGGILIGLAFGWLVSRLIARIDDYLIETTLTTILAFGSYLIAEEFHVSGVLAVVAAGLINGNIGPRGMSPTTRIVLFNFWEYFAFLASSLVFLLIGLKVDLPNLLAAWQPILIAVLAVLVARAIVVYGLSWLANRVAEPIPIKWQHVINWGGLRGAIGLALALSLPASMGSQRDLLIDMAFGVVLFTLLVQSTTMRLLIQRLGIVIRGQSQIEYDTRLARLTSLQSAGSQLSRRHHDGLISNDTWKRIKQLLDQQTEAAANSVREIALEEPALENKEYETVRREVLHARRSALFDLHNEGTISQEVLEKLIAEVDTALQEESEPASIAKMIEPSYKTTAKEKSEPLPIDKVVESASKKPPKEHDK